MRLEESLRHLSGRSGKAEILRYLLGIIEKKKR